MAEIDPRWAWEPYKPSAESPWDIRKVGHLYRRAGFGAILEEKSGDKFMFWAPSLEEGLKAGPDKAIDQLLQGGPKQDKFDFQTDEAKPAAQYNDQYLRAWWLYR